MIKKKTKDGKTFYNIDKLDKNKPKVVANELYCLFLNTIEKVVSLKSVVYKNSIPSFGPDDIRQEIRVIALTALAKFDFDKINCDKDKEYLDRDIEASISTFLSVTIKRRMSNLKRDQSFHIEFPCVKLKCELFSGNKSKPCSNVCKKYKRYKRHMRDRRKLIIPESLVVNSLGLTNKKDNVMLLKLMAEEAVGDEKKALNKFLYKGELDFETKLRIKKKLEDYFSEGYNFEKK